MRPMTCVSPDTPTTEVVFEACEAEARRGKRGETALNTEEETEKLE